MKQKLEQILERYAVEVVPLAEEDGGGYMATFPQLGRMVAGYGETRQEALGDLLGFAPLLLESMEEHGETLPEPEARPPWRDYSGRVTLRIPKMLHAQLERLASREGVSLNALMNHILQAGATALLSGKEFGAIEKQEDYDLMGGAFSSGGGPTLRLDPSLESRISQAAKNRPHLEVLDTDAA
jgi:antitoxin HicB